MFQATEGAGKAVDILINNAGFGTQERFDRLAWEKSAEQIQLNIVSLTELTHRFLAPMLARGRGHVLNVSSIGAYMPVPFYATYAAGKAYVRNFSEAVAAELAGTNVRVCSLCPGGTKTEFLEVFGQRSTWLVEAAMMSADRCARIRPFGAVPRAAQHRERLEQLTHVLVAASSPPAGSWCGSRGCSWARRSDPVSLRRRRLRARSSRALAAHVSCGRPRSQGAP